ncbi:MAG: efflux RND transporter periplasmic adaptor subunit [Bacteroidetes bacterium]|nr:efflux RND transporter periplasmic adaptor subunit [Bacteroidota bacterium]MBU1115864.1 efflux RND transporter periplasmic adaptor subunit [Bacteroidota bacterium]MBU1797978.1 efflux RND transporter periplasmic adaptor subunit [Bacteroidota bacterium]
MEAKNADLSSLTIEKSKRNKNPEQKQKYIRIIITSVIIVVLASVLYIGWEKITAPEVEVKMATAVLQSNAQNNAVLTASGYVVAQRKAAIASKGTGRLVYLGVVEGDKVKRDEIIARLEDNDMKALYAQANANLKFSEASLKEAENNYNREKQLFAAELSSQITLDAAEANYRKVLASIDVAKATVLSAEVSLENTIIRAPFDGTVLSKNADVGEIVAPLAASVNSKSAVVTIADMSSLQVEADVSESNIEKIIPDQDCQITLDAYPSFNYAGYIAKIVPTADRGKATVMVKVGFKNYDQRVLPEMSAKVLFLKNAMKSDLEVEKPSLVIPKTAILNNTVFKVNDGKAYKINVTTGKDFDSYIEITSGLQNGDEIIDDLTEDIKEAIKVKINK